MRIAPEEVQETVSVPEEGDGTLRTSESNSNQENPRTSRTTSQQQVEHAGIPGRTTRSATMFAVPLGEDIKVLLVLVNNLSLKRKVRRNNCRLDMGVKLVVE